MANVSSQNARSHAQKLALTGSALSPIIAGLILKGEEVSAGPVTVLNEARKAYGDDKLSTEFPRLDSKSKDYEGGTSGNGYTEFYKAEEEIAGETTTRNANFFTDWWGAQEAGKVQNYQLAQIAVAQSKDPSKAEQLYREMAPDKLANLKKKLQNAKSKGRTYIRKAIGCWWVMSDLYEHTDKSGNPVCTLAYAEGPTANTYPFDLIDNTQLRNFRPMSVGDVMKLDVAAAIEAGGSLYEQLKLQLKRDTSDKGKNKLPKIERVDQWLDYASRLFDFIDSGSAEGKEHGDAIRARLAQKKGGEHAIEVIGRGMTDFKELWSDGLQTRYSRQIDDQLQATDDKPAITKAA